VQFHLK